jgi:hypothetical protein
MNQPILLLSTALFLAAACGANEPLPASAPNPGTDLPTVPPVEAPPVDAGASPSTGTSTDAAGETASASPADAGACPSSFAEATATFTRASSCQPGSVGCNYDDGACTCLGPRGYPGMWACSKKLSSCPATFAAAQALSAGQCTWSGTGDGCGYPEGKCGCSAYPVCGGANPVYPPQPTWSCRPKVAGCPDAMPSAGSACTKAGAHCAYDCGAAADCDKGHWKVEPAPLRP